MSVELRNSMAALRWLYTVVAGFAVTQAVRTFALDGSGHLAIEVRVTAKVNPDFLVLLVFFSVVIRFAHGAMRHFYRSYEEREEGWLSYEPLIDFFGLFGEALLFMLMAFALNEYDQFVLYYLGLLIVDTLWLLWIPPGDPPYRNWLVGNCIFMLIVLPTYIVWREIPWVARDWMLVGALLVMTALHHVMDYVSPGNWEYYFPGVRAPALVNRVEQNWGRAFLRAGDLFWRATLVGPVIAKLREKAQTRVTE